MKSAVAALFFAALTSAVELTNSAYDVKAGEPFTLTWADASGPVTITLMNGPRDDLQPVETLDANDSANSFTWTPSSSLASDTYAFRIEDDDDTNYSIQWTYVADSDDATSAGMSVTTVVTSSSSTAAASTTAESTASATSSAASESASASASASDSSASASASASASESDSTTASETSSATGTETAAPNTNAAGSVIAPVMMLAAGLVAAL